MWHANVILDRPFGMKSGNPIAVNCHFMRATCELDQFKGLFLMSAS